MIVKKIIVALALCTLSLQAQAECTCVCVNEQLQPYCKSADDLAQPCIGVCSPPRRSESTTVTIVRNLQSGSGTILLVVCTLTNGEMPPALPQKGLQFSTFGPPLWEQRAHWCKSSGRTEWGRCWDEAEAIMARDKDKDASCHISEDYPRATVRRTEHPIPLGRGSRLEGPRFGLLCLPAAYRQRMDKDLFN
jgi:hypothetical protein